MKSDSGARSKAGIVTPLILSHRTRFAFHSQMCKSDDDDQRIEHKEKNLLGLSAFNNLIKEYILLLSKGRGIHHKQREVSQGEEEDGRST